MKTHVVSTIAVLAGLTGLSVGVAHAAPTPGPDGGQALVDFGKPGVVGGDITTGTSFTIGDLTATTNNSGFLAGFGPDFFGKVTFSTTDGTSFSFGDAAFGTFDSTSITESVLGKGVVSFYITGEYTPGTYAVANGASDGPYMASISYGFQQSRGTISDSGSFSVPPTAGIPEASTWAMMALGFVSLFGVTGYRSSRKSGALAV